MTLLHCDLSITQLVPNESEVFVLEVVKSQDFLVQVGQGRSLKKIVKAGDGWYVLQLPAGVNMNAQLITA